MKSSSARRVSKRLPNEGARSVPGNGLSARLVRTVGGGWYGLSVEVGTYCRWRLVPTVGGGWCLLSVEAGRESLVELAPAQRGVRSANATSELPAMVATYCCPSTW